jgi:hypothetical protein
MKLRMYIMALEPISTVYFIDPSHHSVSICASSPTVARQLLGKHVPAATKNYWRVLFYAVHVVSKESRWLVLPRTSCFCFKYNIYVHIIVWKVSIIRHRLSLEVFLIFKPVKILTWPYTSLPELKQKKYIGLMSYSNFISQYLNITTAFRNR